VKIQGVTKVYETGSRSVTALEQVSLDVPEGELVSLVGPSGCGKTTLLRIVGGLTDVSGGEIAVLPRGDGRSRKMSFVFQDVNLLPWRSVVRNVEFGLESANVEKRERRKRAMAALSRVGLGEFADAPPYTLSGGMQQRVGLARALAVEPDVLLMDEPFGALDNFTREGLQEQLAQLWEDLKLTILFVTHDIDEAIFLSSQIALFQSQPGRMVAKLSVPLPLKRWTYDVRSEPAAIDLHRTIRSALAGGSDARAAEKKMSVRI
jgi:NitT/TauT family transport system ATP-binding protein